jgi:hypothetical protein
VTDCDSTALEAGETSLRASWGRPLLLSGVSRRSRSLKTHCAFLTRHALTARTKHYGLTSRSTGPRTLALWILALMQRGQLTYLPCAPATGDQDGKLPAQSEDDDLVVSDCRPVEMVDQEGGFRHQHAALWCSNRPGQQTRKAPQNGWLNRARVQSMGTFLARLAVDVCCAIHREWSWPASELNGARIG